MESHKEDSIGLSSQCQCKVCKDHKESTDTFKRFFLNHKLKEVSNFRTLLLYYFTKGPLPGQIVTLKLLKGDERSVSAVKKILEEGEGCFFERLDDLMVRRASKEKDLKAMSGLK